MGKFILLFLLNLIFLSSCVLGSTVHGTIYDSDLDTVNKIIVEVNSTPLQRHASKYGGYSFELEPGSYHIVAYSVYGDTSAVISEDFVFVGSESGDYIVDLFIFPGVNLTSDVELVNSKFNLDLIFLSIISVFVVIVGFLTLISLKYIKKSKRQDPIVNYNVHYDESSDEVNSELIDTPNVKVDISDISETSDDDLLKKRIISLLDESGGKIPQKDIRKTINLSESKISEVISSLVKEGIVSKVKSGRSNLVVKK